MANQESEPLKTKTLFSTKDPLDYFPFEKIRDSQKVIIEAVSKAFKDAKYVILEAPVGSGKSGVAMTMARYFGDSHILTPRKNLQDQYFEDFHQHLHLMKGRNAYPCTYFDRNKDYDGIIKVISNGGTPSPKVTGLSCAEGPCGNSETIYKRCTGFRDCPYSFAVEMAQQQNHVVYNVHAFIFQAYYLERFQKRQLLVVDEAHDLSDILRDFLTKTFTHRGKITDFPKSGTLDDYVEYLSQAKFMPTDKEEKEEYVGRLTQMITSPYLKDFVFDVEHYKVYKLDYTRFSFVPTSIGNAPHNYLFQFGEKILLMSGTIYDKNSFCNELGISPEEAVFIRVPSTFPVKNRPIVMKTDYMVDTSHKCWKENFDDLTGKIKKVMGRFPEVKGLIHAPSYMAMKELVDALKDPRVVCHDRDNFAQKLQEFYDSDKPLVFISPICQQGVDFKDDRARFQMILRVPYPNAGDKFTAMMMEKSYSWYNRKALITFGQQIGRVNRSEEDHGVTVLMDARFPQFVRRNKKLLPKWLLDAVIEN